MISKFLLQTTPSENERMSSLKWEKFIFQPSFLRGYVRFSGVVILRMILACGKLVLLVYHAQCATGAAERHHYGTVEVLDHSIQAGRRIHGKPMDPGLKAGICYNDELKAALLMRIRGTKIYNLQFQLDVSETYSR